MSVGTAIKEQGFSRGILKTCCSMANLLQPEDVHPAVVTEGQKNRLERGLVLCVKYFCSWTAT